MRKNNQSRLIVNILASKWAVHIMRILGDGTKRFNEIRRHYQYRYKKSYDRRNKT
jgi:DNA-binding HxlR family transcriptional regulator